MEQHNERLRKHQVFDRGLNQAPHGSTSGSSGSGGGGVSGGADQVAADSSGGGEAEAETVAREVSTASIASASSGGSGGAVAPHTMVRVAYGHGALGPKYMYVVVPEGENVGDVVPGEDAEVVSQVGSQG